MLKQWSKISNINQTRRKQERRKRKQERRKRKSAARSGDVVQNEFIEVSPDLLVIVITINSINFIVKSHIVSNGI